MDLNKIIESFGERYTENIAFLQKIIEKLNLNLNSKILDIGTGGGRMAVILALNGYNVVTGEPEGHEWGEWQDLAKEADVLSSIRFRYFRAESLPFEENSFDAIFLFGSLHHMVERYEALQECVRVVKKSQGYIVVIEFTPEGIKSIKKRHNTHPDAVDPRDYLKDRSLKVEIVQSSKLNAYIFNP
ncbi:MAG: class I SAM-dependent methyltransferase [Candidatus Lokiarchaeota archaeon]